MARMTDATGGGQSAQQNITVDAQGQESLMVPHADYIANAEILRDGQDLVLRHPDGGTFTVEGYFSAQPAPTITSAEGAALSPEMVRSFVQPAHEAQQYAQAGHTANDESPVGSVGEVSGSATITRSDGSSEAALPGTPVYAGDIVETSADGAVNIVFVDETTFAVSNNARLSIDEYVFDPATSSGTTQFSVLRGMFVFVSGLIGREDPDDVEINTPVGSIGIRGTSIAGNVDTGEITVIEGAIVMRSLDGRAETTLAAQFETARFNSANGTIENMGVKDSATMTMQFSALQVVAPAFFATTGDSTPQNSQQSPTQQPAPTEAAPAGEAAPIPAPPEVAPPGGYNETSFDGGSDAGFANAVVPANTTPAGAAAAGTTSTAAGSVAAANAAANTTPALTNTNDTAATLQPPPPPPAVTNAGSGTTTANPGGTVTTPPAAPDPDMVINVTANGTYSSGSGDDTYNVSIGTFGNIAAAAGYDRVLVDTIGSINLSGGSLVGVEEFSTANPQGNNVVMTYDLTMTTGSDNNQLLVELDAADTLFLNMQNLGFRLTDVRADSLTLSNGTQTVLIETPDINNVNLSGIDALQIGAVMSDGSIFAGYTDNFEMLFVTSVASAPLTWNDGSGTGYVLTGSSFTDGQSNTNNLVATDSNTVLGGMQAHNAAQYAFDLTAHGYSDWYLPSNDELITLYQNKVSGSFNGIYWSSTDSAMSSEAFAFNFGTGQEVDTLKSNSLQVLAVRRMERVEIDGHFLGDATPQTRNVTRESSHVELRGGTDDLIITTSAVRDSYFNGGDGYDRMLLQDDGILDLAALGQGNVRQFEEIRFDLPGTQTIRITLDQIFQLMKESDASNTLSISSPGGDPKTLEIVGGGTPTLGGAFDEMGAAADEYSFVINSVVHTLYIDDSITVAVV